MPAGALPPTLQGQPTGRRAPVRDGDRTRWLVPEDLQRLVAPGWVQKGSYSDLTGCVPGPALIVKLGARGADLLQAEGVKDQRSRRPRRHGSDERQVGGKLVLVPVDELEYVGPPPGIWLRARPACVTGLGDWSRVRHRSTVSVSVPHRTAISVIVTL